MDRIDYSYNGGFRETQYTMNFMQKSYSDPLKAIAILIGDKAIISGLSVAGGSASDGWISLGGEPVFFQGGTLQAQFIVEEVPESRVFFDGSTHDVYFTKRARFSSPGTYNFSDLKNPGTLLNIWKPGDLKQKYVDNTYITTNFDINGFGLNTEVGWRILSKQVPAAAGKVFVNLNPSDTDFDTAGKTGGAKTATIAKTNLPNITIDVPIPAIDTSIDETGSGKLTGGGSAAEPIAGPTLKTAALGSGTPLSVEDPYFVVLTLIKLDI